MEIYFYYAVIFLFGLIVGSFLNAVIYRLYTKEKITKGRSHCVDCNKTLQWRELFPVASFIVQRGRCRGCGEAISWQYPLVETATGLMFAWVFYLQFSALQLADIGNQAIVQFIFMLIVISSLVVIFVYDLKHYLIPDKVLLPLIGITAFARLFDFWALGHWRFISGEPFGFINLNSFISAFVVGLLASLFFFSLFYFSKGKAMGFGDVKLAFFMGLLLGFPGILVALFLAFTIGAIMGVGLMVIKGKSFQSKIPFAPFLVLGTVVALFFSREIIDWYLSLFL